MSSIEELYQIADELRAVASLGLRFAENDYDAERYQRVLAASSRLVGVLEQKPPDEILLQFQGNLFHVSPLAGSNAAVVRDGQLFIKRRDNGLWALPGGLAEVGETLAQAAQRELEEEAGIRGLAIQLLGIFDSRLCHSQVKFHMYWAVFLIEASPAKPIAGPETTAAAFFDESALPPLSPGHHVIVPRIFQMLRGEKPVPFFDPVDKDVRAECRLQLSLPRPTKRGS